ncbi:heavy-metal-associated domain-containing protein [Bergeriella denitrificans]|uniref:Mercuric transport family protein n=1 Tax=Bergeriella denitrificans TaxID=494 RepID=A0A378UGQ3_BERDE|nr:heavy-metal-associated domain-containing protein [Bergeriella denitrificans]STZ76487.1 mercuric transport family protein [Bergeriella denitrificans]
MANITLNISGMTCGGCVKSVTRILEGVEGVAKAEVSLEQNTAVVEYDEAQTTPAALIEAVEDGGFDAAEA